MPSASVPSDGRYNPGPVQEKKDKLRYEYMALTMCYREVSRWSSLFLYCDKLVYELWCEDASVTILNVCEHLLNEYEVQCSNLQLEVNFNGIWIVIIVSPRKTVF